MAKLKEVCKTLYLAYIADEFESIPFENKEQYLHNVLMLEINSRQTTKISRLMKKAKFRELKWHKDYEWNDDIHLPATTSKEEICDLRFLKETKFTTSWFFRNGKTHLAMALGVKACEKGYEVRFFRVADLVGRLEEALKEGTLQELRQQIDKCDLLILDEVGYVPFQKQGSELLFHIIADCYNHKSVIDFSNLEFGQ